MSLSLQNAEHGRPTLLSRRAVLAGALAGTGALLLGRAGFGGAAHAIGVPNGAALGPADANGWRLPPGFTSRVVAVTGQPVGATGYRWHGAPDGGATFAQPDGGWVYVSNSELDAGLGGAGMIRFGADGAIVAAGALLGGTSMNCSGGATPWGTYLSCEERPGGLVWELDPLGQRPPAARRAMGAFQHEGLTVDTERRAFYLTEDRPNGGLYRFRPDAWPDLASGRLDVLAWTPSGVWWAPVPDPSGAVTPPHLQRGDIFRFNGGEGIWYADGMVYFTTKGDGWVWRLELDELRLGVVYNPQRHPNPQLSGVDQLVVTPWGDLAVAEDGGDMQVVFVRQNGEVAVFAQLDGVAGSELTGLAFDPSGRRLYVTSQRNPGVTYELSGDRKSVV